MNKEIFITITPKGIESSGVTFEQAFELLLSSLRQFALELIELKPDDQDLKDTVYDWMNQGMSGILHEIDPTVDPNPDIDINKIIAMQDVYINDKLQELRTTNPRLYKSTSKKIKAQQEEKQARILEAKLKREKEA